MKIPLAYNQLLFATNNAVGLGQGLSILDNITTQPVVVAQGTGYKVNDVLQIQGGTSIIKATVQVTAINPINGGVVSVAVVLQGVYTAAPSAGAATADLTNAGGTGCTITGNWLANSIPQNSIWAELTVEVADARMRDDGTAPTAGVGFIIKASTSTPTPFVYFGPLSKVSIIGTGTTTVVNVLFYTNRSKQ